MNLKTQLKIFVVAIILLVSCKETSFNEVQPLNFQVAPTSLSYIPVTGVREYRNVESTLPSVSSQGLPVYYEILDGRKEDGTSLGDEYLLDVSIGNPVEGVYDVPVYDENGEVSHVHEKKYINSANAGVIRIADNNSFGLGDYYFDIAASTVVNGNKMTTVFIDAFHLKVGPQLPSNLVYIPFGQNLIVGSGTMSTVPMLIDGNPDVRYELATDTDKLVIDTETGVISLKEGYTVTEPENVYPEVSVISNISEEVTTFGDGFFRIVISNEPYPIEKAVFNFFYPTMANNNAASGLRWYVTNNAGLLSWKVWMRQAPPAIAASERPDDVTENKSIVMRNAWGPSVPHENWVVMNEQDLNPYKLGFDITATYWINYEWLAYLESGRTPVEIEVFITNNFTGAIESTEWTQINDVIKCYINNEGDGFVGTPYPGDQSGADPDMRKDPAKNNQNIWIKSVIDLEPYKEWEHFTLAFKYKSNFTGTISGDAGSASNTWLSDINYKAVEK